MLEHSRTLHWLTSMTLRNLWGGICKPDRCGHSCEIIPSDPSAWAPGLGRGKDKAVSCHNAS